MNTLGINIILAGIMVVLTLTLWGIMNAIWQVGFEIRRLQKTIEKSKQTEAFADK